MIDKQKQLDLNRREIDVPELGGKVLIRELTVLEAGKIYAECQKYPEDIRNWWDSFHTIAAAVLKEDGTPLFTVEEVAAFPRSKTAALIRIRDEIVGNEAVLEKNSETAPTVSSSSS